MMNKLKNWRDVSGEQYTYPTFEREDGVQVFFDTHHKTVGFYIMDEDISIEELEAITKTAKQFFKQAEDDLEIDQLNDEGKLIIINYNLNELLFKLDN